MPKDEVLVIITESDSTIGNQVKWLFGVSGEKPLSFSVRKDLESSQDKLAFSSKTILEYIGISVESNDETYLDEMIKRFDTKFPTTKIFSEFSRSTCKESNEENDPDVLLMNWMDREEVLFRTFEKYMFDKSNSSYQKIEIDEFIKRALSLTNRRKSRVGHALENHLQEIFDRFDIKYDNNKFTENKAKPDFIFPSIEKYKDKTFKEINLTMLGVKTTCKDRWRQVLAEANRISEKHLFTLQPSISTNQTSEMRDKNIQLVIPKVLHDSYTLEQRKHLQTLNSFLELLKEKENKHFREI
jgi:hypothetical protein